MAISSVLKAGTFSALVYRRSYLPAKKGGKMGVYRLRTYMTKTSKEPFLNGSSSTYVEEMYKAWLKNPESVHKSWDAFFRSTSEGADPGAAYQSPPLAPVQYVHVPVGSVPSTALTSLAPSSVAPQYVEPRGIEDHLSVQAIIRSYQVRGHLVSKLDPLGITAANIHSAFSEGSPSSPQVVLRSYQLEEKDMDRLFKLPGSTFIGGEENVLSLREILKRLEDVYCGHIGIEYMFINSQEQCTWIRKKFETPGVLSFTKEQKRLLMARLIRSTKLL